MFEDPDAGLTQRQQVLRAAESTGSGNTAGPAEKLWIRCTVTESVEREGELGLEV